MANLKEMTGKRLKGRLGGGAGYTVRTDDLMAEAGCLYHTSWIIDDQPWPINVRGGQKFIFVPYTGPTNDAGMLAWNREADYFQQMIRDQFDTLYREGTENGRVMCLALHPHNIGRPNAPQLVPRRFMDQRRHPHAIAGDAVAVVLVVDPVVQQPIVGDARPYILVLPIVDRPERPGIGDHVVRSRQKLAPRKGECDAQFRAVFRWSFLPRKALEICPGSVVN
jgi:hypothetical protein